jgi:beta-glucosidase
MLKYQQTIACLTLEEKIALCSGASFWETKAFPQYGIPASFMCDGPHGLRKQTGTADHLGLNASLGTTCFPTACTAAAGWDTDLLRRMGEALGKEALREDVNIILGPGVNMKRNPLCGRNFEYYSEDPFLSGKLAAAWIQGVQGNGVGVSLKHFAANNQENKRLSSDSLIDERALREYYLSAFEIAVKEARPFTVMCAYPKLNGIYCSDNKGLLRDILRDEWGFDGAVVTDWGAMNDRIAGFKAGLDLEMPGSQGRFDAEVKAAVQSGALDERLIDTAVERLLTLIGRTTLDRDKKTELPEDLHERHHKLAREIAAASAVLLKNDDRTLPLPRNTALTVIGALAETPRYQGSGSSRVTPTQITSLLDGLPAYTQNVYYRQGYRLEDEPDEQLLKEALEAAGKGGLVVLCIGLTDIYESEAFDRSTLSIPRNQIALIEAVSRVNPNIAVVLAGGSAVEMPWLDKVKALLHTQLAGQAGGLAAADILFGEVNPSGKLTETYPLRYEDVVSSAYYGRNPKQAAYFESMYCGYRYFDTVDKPVLFPFGYGLSYTTFEYSGIEVTRCGMYDCEIAFTVKNTGDTAGSEITQLYIAPPSGDVYRPAQELKGFSKVKLEAGEISTVVITLAKRGFAHYDPEQKDWLVEAGNYEIRVGASSRDIRLKKQIEVDGIFPQKSDCSPWYYTLRGTPSKEDFTTVYGDYPDYIPQTKGSYDLCNSIKEMKDTSLLCRFMYREMEKTIAKSLGCKIDYNNVQFKMLMETAGDNPLKTNMLFSPDTMTAPFVQFVLDTANGHFWKGLGKLIRGKRIKTCTG